MRTMPRIKDITGQKFGRLTAIEMGIGTDTCGGIIWKFQCDCGNVEFTSGALVKQRVKQSKDLTRSPSCGCGAKEIATQIGQLRGKANATHNLSKHPIYSIWQAMRNRCYSSNNKEYAWYGGKGVYVCEEWKNDPEAFITWALANGWKKGLTIDKDILCDKLGLPKHYSPQTCQFITLAENIVYANNREI